MRPAFRIIASLLSLAVVIQVGLAGYGAFNAIDKADDAGSVTKKTIENGFDPHGVVGSIVVLLMVILLIVAAGAALALSEGLRKKVLDALFGAEEEFEYSSTTTSSSSAPQPAGAAT